MSIHSRLEELQITLPVPATPAAAYVPFVRSGNLLFLSGHLARKEGSVWAGRLGTDMHTQEGRDAARAVAIDLMATMQAALGDLDRVTRIVKLVSLVHSSPDFIEHHLVTNGASELLVQVFGAAGVHARSAFGAAQLPLGACVEIELVAEVR